MTPASFPVYGDRFLGSAMRIGRCVAPSEPPSDWPSTVLEHNKNNFLANNETRVMIGKLSADWSFVEVAGLPRRGDGTGEIAERGAERVDSIGSRSIRAGPGGPARTGNCDGGEFAATVGPAALGRPAGSWTRALCSSARRTIGKRSAGDSPNANRPEMAPQVFGKARFAPGTGAPAGPVDPLARALPSSNRVGQVNCKPPGNGAAID